MGSVVEASAYRTTLIVALFSSLESYPVEWSGEHVRRSPHFQLGAHSKPTGKTIAELTTDPERAQNSEECRPRFAWEASNQNIPPRFAATGPTPCTLAGTGFPPTCMRE